MIQSIVLFSIDLPYLSIQNTVILCACNMSKVRTLGEAKEEVKFKDMYELVKFQYILGEI